jgi:hypothetical protein
MMTPDEYRAAEPHHLAVVEWWVPEPHFKPFARVVRATYHLDRTPWKGHPFNFRNDQAGADFVNQWALETGYALDKLSPSGRTSEGWGELERGFSQATPYARRVDALEVALRSIEKDVSHHRRQLAASESHYEWIRTAIKGERIDAS